jgi:hypothetical protein
MSTLAVKNVLVPQTPWWSPGHAPNDTPVTLNGTGAGFAVAVGVVRPCAGAAVGVDVWLEVGGVVFPVMLVVGVLLRVLELETREPQPARNRVRSRYIPDNSRRRDDPENRVS